MMQTGTASPGPAKPAELQRSGGDKGPERWLFSVDLLRGLAAFAVFAFHAEGSFWRRQAPTDPFHGLGSFLEGRSAANIASFLLCGFGFLGVPLFFVISGFCIHLPLAGKAAPLDLRSFFVRRFFRLYPLYLLVVVGVMVLIGLKYPGSPEVTAANFLGHLVFWHYNTPPSTAGMGISPVLWSIAVEVQFYVLYALLLPLLRRAGLWRCAGVFLLLGIVYRALYWHEGGPSWPRPLHPTFFAPGRFGEWLLGAALAESFVRGQLSSAGLRNFAAIGGVALLAASGAAVIALRADRSWVEVPSCVGFAAVLAGLLAREWSGGPPARGVLTGAAKHLGDRSYSLYLVHFTVLNVVVEVAARALHIHDKDAMGGTRPMLLAVLLGAVATFLVTETTYRLVEAPSHRLARRLARRAATPAVEPAGGAKTESR